MNVYENYIKYTAISTYIKLQSKWGITQVFQLVSGYGANFNIFQPLTAKGSDKSYTAKLKSYQSDSVNIINKMTIINSLLFVNIYFESLFILRNKNSEENRKYQSIYHTVYTDLLKNNPHIQHPLKVISSEKRNKTKIFERIILLFNIHSQQNYICLQYLSFQQNINLSLQDLSDDPLNVNGLNIVRNGISQSYVIITQQCNQNLMKLTPYPNFYQKTYDIPHFEFDQINIEMDVIKIDQKMIFQQNFLLLKQCLWDFGFIIYYIIEVLFNKQKNQYDRYIGIRKFEYIHQWILTEIQIVNTNYLLEKNICNNIMYSALFSSALTFYSQCYQITQNIEDSYILQITFVWNIFGDWNDGSYLGIYISGEPLFQNNMVKIFKTQGEYYLNFILLMQLKPKEELLKQEEHQQHFKENFIAVVLRLVSLNKFMGVVHMVLGIFMFINRMKIQKLFQAEFMGYLTSVLQIITHIMVIVSKIVLPTHILQQQQSVIFDTNYQQSNRLGSYIVKDFYDNNFDQKLIKQIFQIIPPTFNNYQNGQPFSFIGNKKILGGFNSWGYGSYGIQIDLPIHNQVRIYFKLYLIDDWQNGDQFKYVIYSWNNPDQQLQGLSILDQLINAQEQLRINFHCQTSSKNSSVASCGISDLFILYDQVNLFINVFCNQSYLYFTYLTNNCEICDGSDYFLYSSNYYSNQLNEKAFFGCQERYHAINQMNVILVAHHNTKFSHLMEHVSVQVILSFKITNVRLVIIHVKLSLEYLQYNCLSCYSSRQLFRYTCQCLPNYHDVYSVQQYSAIKDHESQQCDYICQTCLLQSIFSVSHALIIHLELLNETTLVNVINTNIQKKICDPSCATSKGAFSQYHNTYSQVAIQQLRICQQIKTQEYSHIKDFYLQINMSSKHVMSQITLSDYLQTTLSNILFILILHHNQQYLKASTQFNNKIFNNRFRKKSQKMKSILFSIISKIPYYNLLYFERESQ
ncbi:hypothetical protein pb186bvf_010469 [Paramecium bursaria]